MKNTTAPVLNCLGVTPTTPPANGVWVNTEKKPNGSYETVAFVNGKFYTSCRSKDLQYNRACIKEDLADGGHEWPKDLAPVMSARMEKKPNQKAA